VKRLAGLLDSLLAYSRAGVLATKTESVDTRQLVDEIVGLLDPPSAFSISISGEMPKLETVRAPLELVLRNLISNAIKHHDRPDGRVVISSTDQGEFYEFAVSDDGAGIPPEFHARVFELFQTLRPRDEVEGSGMGLAIVRKTVAAAGGELRLESDGRRGATFRLLWKKQWENA
jgi:signal transduction histidine kinase